MASADCVSSAGVWSYATPIKHGTGTCVTYCGINSAASRVAWAGSATPRRTIDWMPRADEVWFDPNTGRPTRRFYQFMHEIAEQRLGGVQGRTVPQVVQDVTSTQSAVVATTNYATQVGQYAASVAAVAVATAEVAQDSGLSGADSIPEVPPTPPKFNEPE